MTHGIVSYALAMLEPCNTIEPYNPRVSNLPPDAMRMRDLKPGMYYVDGGQLYKVLRRLKGVFEITPVNARSGHRSTALSEVGVRSQKWVLPVDKSDLHFQGQ